MRPAEANQKWEDKRAALLRVWNKKSAKWKRETILKATKYRSGEDSCNSVYMGGMATASLIHALGGAYGSDSAEELLKKATPAQLTAGLCAAAGTISYMLENPRERCPCCGQIVKPKGEKSGQN